MFQVRIYSILWGFAALLAAPSFKFERCGYENASFSLIFILLAVIFSHFIKIICFPQFLTEPLLELKC